MKPIVILPPKTVSPEDIALLRDNGLCVVEATDPAAVKFLDPIPAAVGRTNVEDAAIALSRKLLNRTTCPWDDGVRASVARMYVELLVAGTPLDPRPTQQEQEQEIFSQAKAGELRRLAREEAKAEREAAKAAKKATSGK